MHFRLYFISYFPFFVISKRLGFICLSDFSFVVYHYSTYFWPCYLGASGCHFNSFLSLFTITATALDSDAGESVNQPFLTHVLNFFVCTLLRHLDATGRCITWSVVNDEFIQWWIMFEPWWCCLNWSVVNQKA